MELTQIQFLYRIYKKTNEAIYLDCISFFFLYFLKLNSYLPSGKGKQLRKEHFLFCLIG